MAGRIAGHYEKSDRSWQRVLRALQSTWREERGLDPGRGGRDDRLIGSRITEEAGDDGHNFLTGTTWARVEKELAQPRDDDGSTRVMEPGRLKTNLLSSQPLAFNLFAELADDTALASRALQLVLPDIVKRVDGIRFEWSPGRGGIEFLGNRSAFDVAVDVQGPDGAGHTLGIEVKYHERLDASAGAVRDRAREVARNAGIDPEDPALVSPPLNQLFLDHMLACSMTQHATSQDSTFVFLYPTINWDCRGAVVEYVRHAPPSSGWRSLTLEELVAAISASTADEWIADFHHRYLDYQRVSDIAGIARIV